MVRQNRSDKDMTFAFLLKRWRAYLGVTQREFAREWGVSASMVQKIEVGDYALGQLSFERLELLRELLELPPDDFYTLLVNNRPAD